MNHKTIKHIAATITGIGIFVSVLGHPAFAGPRISDTPITRSVVVGSPMQGVGGSPTNTAQTPRALSTPSTAVHSNFSLSQTWRIIKAIIAVVGAFGLLFVAGTVVAMFIATGSIAAAILSPIILALVGFSAAWKMLQLVKAIAGV